jgi:hypothetical protein
VPGNLNNTFKQHQRLPKCDSHLASWSATGGPSGWVRVRAREGLFLSWTISKIPRYSSGDSRSTKRLSLYSSVLSTQWQMHIYSPMQTGLVLEDPVWKSQGTRFISEKTIPATTTIGLMRSPRGNMLKTTISFSIQIPAGDGLRKKVLKFTSEWACLGSGDIARRDTYVAQRRRFRVLLCYPK